MKYLVTYVVVAISLMASLLATPVFADETITCESRDHKYNTCSFNSHGYVWLKKQTSKASCIQGVTWDYDKRHIWVDDNCKGVFVVESRHSSGGSESSSGDLAVAVVGAAILAGIAASSNKKANKNNTVNDKYSDDDYHGPRHSSYVPDWLVGDFQGYNIHDRAQIKMTISEDGKMTARSQGLQTKGYVNDERLFAADYEFFLTRTEYGFTTTQVGNYDNVVVYTRID